MKTLIAIVHCRTRQLYMDAIRSTWLPLVPAETADIKFFVGKGECKDLPKDVVELDCGDGYEFYRKRLGQLLGGPWQMAMIIRLS